MQTANAQLRAEMPSACSSEVAPLGEAVRPYLPFYFFNVLGSIAKSTAVATNAAAAAHRGSTRSDSAPTWAAGDSLGKDWCSLSAIKGGWANDDPSVVMQWENKVLANVLDWVVDGLHRELGHQYMDHESRQLPSLQALAQSEPCPELIWLRMINALMQQAGQLRAASVLPAHDVPAVRIGTGVCVLMAAKELFAQRLMSAELGLAATLSGMHSALSQVGASKGGLDCKPGYWHVRNVVVATVKAY